MPTFNINYELFPNKTINKRTKKNYRPGEKQRGEG